MLHSRNNELWKINQESRLLLRELSYASLITSYVDNVVSDQDKTESLRDAKETQHLRSSKKRDTSSGIRSCKEKKERRVGQHIRAK